MMHDDKHINENDYYDLDDYDHENYDATATNNVETSYAGDQRLLRTSRQILPLA